MDVFNHSKEKTLFAGMHMHISNKTKERIHLAFKYYNNLRHATCGTYSSLFKSQISFHSCAREIISLSREIIEGHFYSVETI